jgi:hypothetical protein
MYGELYYKPWELAKVSFVDVVLSLKGLRNKDLYDQLLLRRSTFIIASSMPGSKAGRLQDKLWPVPGEKKTGRIPQAALDQLKRFKEIQAQKDAAGIKVTNNG